MTELTLPKLEDCTMDFFADWREILIQSVLAQGYDSIGPDNCRTIYMKLANIQNRQVSAQPRTVYVSRQFSCPPEYEDGLKEIVRKAEKGESLRPHLSTKLVEADFQDTLLSDWGILHLHLGIKPHNFFDGFNERSGPVLFTRVTADALYLIDVKGHDGWTDETLMEILHDNWPDSIAHFRFAPGTKPAYPDNKKPTAAERKLARRHGINLFLELSDGTAYLPTGGGLTTAGTSIKVTMDYNNWHRHIKALPDLIELAHKEGKIMAPPYHFKLRGFQAQGPVVSEENSQMAFLLD